MKIDKNTRRGRAYFRFLYSSLLVAVLSLTGVWLWELWNRVPSNIRVRVGQEQGLSFYVPATATIYREGEEPLANVSLSQELIFYGEVEETFTMQVELFGFIPFKETALSVVQDKQLIPVGSPIGIYVHTQGVLIIDMGEFENERGKKVAPAEGVLQPGDYIRKINSIEVYDKEQLMDIIAASNGNALSMELKRGEELTTVEVIPQKDQQGEYKLGIWVRDNAQGIGTMTFVDEEGYFGALGHGINDMDTAKLMELKEGGLYKADIVSVNKGTPGEPGELSGIIAYAEKNKLGEILYNSNRGIYGKVEIKNLNLTEGPMPLALKQEIEEGPAQILCTLTDTPAYYDVEILTIHEENDQINRGMELLVTDNDLLEKTGGIIQGMSGSPILQDGKIIGAVTHVLVNDPTRGYGIFIENMLETVE